MGCFTHTNASLEYCTIAVAMSTSCSVPLTPLVRRAGILAQSRQQGCTVEIIYYHCGRTWVDTPHTLHALTIAQ
jgi:hypothetical protein